MKEQEVYVGVDVAKAFLDVAWGEEFERVPNDDRGRSALLKRLSQIAGSVQVICEASGGYERALIQALQGGAIKVSPSPGQPSAAVCSCLWHPGQDRLH